MPPLSRAAVRMREKRISRMNAISNETAHDGRSARRLDLGRPSAATPVTIVFFLGECFALLVKNVVRLSRFSLGRSMNTYPIPLGHKQR